MQHRIVELLQRVANEEVTSNNETIVLVHFKAKQKNNTKVLTVKNFALQFRRTFDDKRRNE